MRATADSWVMYHRGHPPQGRNEARRVNALLAKYEAFLDPGGATSGCHSYHLVLITTGRKFHTVVEEGDENFVYTSDRTGYLMTERSKDGSKLPAKENSGDRQDHEVVDSHDHFNGDLLRWKEAYRKNVDD